MNFSCNDIFMIRAPAFPFNDAINFINDSNDIGKFLTNKDYSVFFNEALYVSSHSLYKTLENKQSLNIKSQISLNNTLAKYFIRACTRATPYGLYSSVNLGQFTKEDNLTINKAIIRKKVSVDNEWISKIIFLLHKDEFIFSKLSFVYNPLVYQNGSRIQNPYSSNLFFDNDSNISSKSIHIENNNLLKLIKEECKNFVTYKLLISKIIKKYPKVSRETIDKVLYQLLESEIIFSNLQLEPFVEDSLDFLISKLKQLEINSSLYFELKNIKQLILKYENSYNNIRLLSVIYEKMEGIIKVKDYLKVDYAKQLSNNSLDKRHRDKLENFVNQFSHLFVDPQEYSNLANFKKKFSERYGSNTDVPLIEVIDENSFNGLSIFKQSESNSLLTDRESLIKSVIDNRIISALSQNKDEIILDGDDFKEVNNDSKKYLNSFDLNFIIAKSINNYRYFLAPSVGSHMAGAMFQRFNNILDKKTFNNYLNIYNLTLSNVKKNYKIVELRECLSTSRSNNVISNRKIYNNTFCIGYYDKNSILINDLTLSINHNQELILKHKNQKIKIVSNHMLNNKLYSLLGQLLLAISSEYEITFIERLYSLYNNAYIYLPRIVFEDVIISPKMWNISTNTLKINSFKQFIIDFRQIVERYRLDKYIYLCEQDNRLLIDVNNEFSLKYLYAAFKKTKNLNLREVEISHEYKPLIVDQYNKEYLAEFVFSFVNNKENIKEEKNISKPIQVIDGYNLGEKGWIYFKLYNVNSRQDELIKNHLQDCFQELKPDNYFFIRYYDDQQHLRIRMKFKDRDIAYKKLSTLANYLDEWNQLGFYSEIKYACYYPEYNRYGGKFLSNELHQLFQIDSEWVIQVLKYFDINNIDDRQKAYFVGMFSLNQALVNNIEELFNIFDEDGLRSSYKKEYKLNKEKYLNWLKNILDNQIEIIDSRFMNLKEIFEKRNKLFQDYGKLLLIEENNLSNSIKEIVFSLSHMFCNRLNANLEYENYYNAIIRHSLYHYLSSSKVISNKE